MWRQAREPEATENPFLLSFSDLMAALLLMFILLLVVTMLRLQREVDLQRDRAERITVIKDEIIQRLRDAFAEEGIYIEVDPQTGAIKLSSDVLFATGKSELRPAGLAAIDRIIPIYLDVLLSPDFQDEVTQIIIEGHTDPQPQWGKDVNRFAHSYDYNLELSQRRALEVAQYVLNANYDSRDTSLTHLRNYEIPLKERLTANGRSFAQLVDASNQRIQTVPYSLIESGVLNPDSTSIDFEKSRRVEFKFRLNDEQYLEEIRQLLQVN